MASSPWSRVHVICGGAVFDVGRASALVSCAHALAHRFWGTIRRRDAALL